MTDTQKKPRGPGMVAGILRAMADNYTEAHTWDDLDAEVCRQAADQLAALAQPAQAERCPCGLTRGECAVTRCSDAHPPAPSAEALPRMRSAFRTTVIQGGERPAYTMVFAFSSSEDLNAADDEWRAALRKADRK